MQNIVIAKPYRFIPPYKNPFWTRIFRYWVRRHVHKDWGVERIPTLSRKRCRQVFEERFSASRMARDYVAIFQGLVAGKAAASSGT